MPPASRRLPEDSVVASLSEIQSLLQATEPSRTSPPATKPVTTSEAAVDRTAVPSAPVPSAAELRATREARWREEMLDANSMGQNAAPRSRRWVYAVGFGLALAGAALAFVLTRPAPAPAVPALVVAPAQIMPVSAAATPATSTAESVVEAPAIQPPAAPREPIPVRQAAGTAPRVRGRERTATAPRSDDLDAVFGPRRTVSTATPKPRTAAPTNRKKTRADAQLDSVLDSL
jgi:hypothetical protein